MHALSARPLKVRELTDLRSKRGRRRRDRVSGREFSPCADESKDFRQPSPVGEGVSRRLTDEVSIEIIALSRRRTGSTHARPSFFSGRADNACTNLLGFFVCCVRTRGMVVIEESGETIDLLH